MTVHHKLQRTKIKTSIQSKWLPFFLNKWFIHLSKIVINYFSANQLMKNLLWLFFKVPSKWKTLEIKRILWQQKQTNIRTRDPHWGAEKVMLKSNKRLCNTYSMKSSNIWLWKIEIGFCNISNLCFHLIFIFTTKAPDLYFSISVDLRWYLPWFYFSYDMGGKKY